MKTCCEHYAINCRQGRDCPERTLAASSWHADYREHDALVNKEPSHVLTPPPAPIPAWVYIAGVAAAILVALSLDLLPRWPVLVAAMGNLP